MFWPLLAPHFAALLASAVISSSILNYFLKLFYIWYMQNHFYLNLKDSDDGVLQWAWLIFWALSAVMDFFYTTKFWKLSPLSFWGRRGRTTTCSRGPLCINKSSSFRPAHKIYYSCSPLLQLEMKADSISRTLWYRKPQDSGMDNVWNTGKM